MFSDAYFLKYVFFLFLAAILMFPVGGTFAMGGKPETPPSSTQALNNMPESKITLKQLAEIYWPDSNATQLQQEETLKNLLGKRVSWEITVAQIQRDGSRYLVQGQSDKDMLGTFSYVQPRDEAQKQQLLNASMGSKLHVSGIVKDMQMRHIVLDPAFIDTNAE